MDDRSCPDHGLWCPRTYRECPGCWEASDPMTQRRLERERRDRDEEAREHFTEPSTLDRAAEPPR